MNMQTLQDKVAVVTGAGGTMGGAVVQALVAQGCRVAMVDVNAAALGVQQSRWGSRVMSVPCDIRDAADVDRAHRALVEALGPVAVLVNNAGVLSNHKIEATTADEWRQVLSVNLDGALHWTQATVPHRQCRFAGQQDRRADGGDRLFGVEGRPGGADLFARA
jgi:3-oxoacyl-[acyl-carrier protein] reductase